jgi:two-component system, NarL family, sensor kinase
MPEDYRDIQEGLTNYVQIGTAIFLVLAILFIGFILFSVQRRRKLEINAKELKSQFQQELLRTQLEIQEQTLKNISEEIHDNIGQALSLAKLNLYMLPESADEAAQQKISNTKELVSKAIVDLRGLSRSLDTEFIQDLGLQQAIEYELDMIKKTGTHNTILEVEGTVFRFDKQKELIVFRIVQEVLNNIIKHAKADKIIVQANYQTDKLQLTVTDNGQGVDLTPLNENDHSNFGLGIRNMHNRAKLINAGFSMNSTIGKGTEVKIILPKENNNATTG